MLRKSARRLALCTTAMAALAIGLLAPPAASAASNAQIEVLSGHADMISAGTALVKVTGLKNHDRILAAGVDVTDSFQQQADGLVGLVQDLPLGESRLVVQAVSGKEQTGLDVVNHPRSGPVFSGPQHVLFCQATGLGALDEDCMTDEVVVQYRYRTTANQFANYPTDGSVPANLATTVVDGVEVPYVYRLERGTINRSLYQIAILHQPGTPEPTPWTDTAAWNDKLVYTFGGACGVGLGQGNGTGGVENHGYLSAGYAVASGSLNVYATSCDDVVSAETAYMVKEQFIESYGVPRFTMGSGGSAGMMQQMLLSNNYPGIIDGVLASGGYGDERTTTVTGHDCRGLTNFWNSPAGAGWSNAEKLAVSGHATTGTCGGYGFFDGVDDPNRGCPGVVPSGQRWSPSNPDGIRCTIADTMTNVYGTDDQGRGLRVIPDNVGVQYGLNGLTSGTITMDKFLALNANVGGMDIDGLRSTARSEASVSAIERGFETGRFNLTTGGLSYIPVIDHRSYTDTRGDFHDSYRSAVIRERFLNAYGDAETHIGWRATGPGAGVMNALAIEKMDEWLTNLEAAGALENPSREATIQARPGDIQDGCWINSTTFTAGALDWYQSGADNPCNEAMPFHADPRIMAGGPLSTDVMKCKLTAPERGDYPAMTDAQWAQLNTVFADGVCDYSKRSQGYAELEGTWLSFGTDDTVALSKPVITGTPRVGDTLGVRVTAAPGATLSYQWMVDGVAIEGATGSTFELTPDHRLATATVRVTASADGLVGQSLVSDPSKKIRQDNKGGNS